MATGLGNSHLGEVRHVCAFFRDEVDARRTLTPFTIEGLRCGHKAINVVRPDRADDHLRRLQAEGIDTEHMLESGQLDIRFNTDTYLHQGRFDVERMLASFEAVAADNAASGRSPARIICDMDWTPDGAPQSEELIEFEARVNDIWRRYDDIVICAYDLSKISSEMVLDIVRTHPMVLIGDAIHANPFFRSPDSFLEELRSRDTASSLTNDQTQTESKNEATELRRGLGDIVGLLGLASQWSGCKPGEIANGLGETLLSLCRPEFVFVELDGAENSQLTFVHAAGTLPIEAETGLRPELCRALGASPADWPALSSCEIAARTLSVAVYPLGVGRRLGTVAIGAARPTFPTDIEKVSFSAACSQAVVALQDGRLLAEEQQKVEDLTSRVNEQSDKIAEITGALRIAAAEEGNDGVHDTELSARLLIDGIPGFVAVLGPDGTLRRANRQIQEYFGDSVANLRTLDTDSVVHPDDLPGIAKVFSRSIAAGAPYDVEQRLRRFDGEYRWFGNRGLPVHDADRKVLGWYVLLTDIDDRKRAEQALAASERDLQLTIDTIPALAWSARADGTAEFFNQHYLDYVGKTAEGLGDWQWLDLVHPDDLSTISSTWENARHNATDAEVEARLLGHDGTYRWFRFQTSALRDEQGRVVKWYGINTDIEDRKRAEQELEAREQKLREAHEHLTQAQRLTMTGSFRTDVLGDIHIQSDELFRILEHRPDKLQSFRACVHPEDVGAFDAAFSQAMANKSNFDVTFRFITPNGTIKHLHAVAHFLPGTTERPVVMGSIQDVTERTRTQDELRRSTEYLEAGERVSLTGSFGWNIATDEMRYSQQLCHIHELDPQAELTGADFRARFHPDDLPTFEAQVAELANGRSYIEYEMRLLMPDGRIKHVRAYAQLLQQPDGTMECVGAVQDITQRRSAELALDDLRAELAHMTRVSSLGELTASIAHEVNQPLSGIITNASAGIRFLSGESPNIDAARKTLERSLRDGNRASEVVRRLRELFQKRDFVEQSVDLNEAASEVLAICNHDLQRRRIKLRFDPSERLPLVRGDKVQLQQVILNFILNAADAVDRGGNERGQVFVETSEAAPGASQLTVKDNGPGLSASEPGRLFEPFYTTKANGMGIGLSVSRTIIDRYGGKIWASNNSGPGATFAFSLPRADQPHERDIAHQDK